jgi:DNA topoisomerase VI subunit B
VRLAQVFANLLNNAAKYTNEQGEIAVTVRREGKDAVVSVRDNGLGIPKEMLGRVFEIFAQVDGLQGRAGGGLGIGLTLVRSLVAMHGGSVAVASEGRGTGSEFVVRLPLSVATEPRSSAPRYAPAAAPRRTACSSSTTTSTRPRASAWCSSCSAPRCASSTAAPTRWRR